MTDWLDNEYEIMDIMEDETFYEDYSYTKELEFIWSELIV